MTDQTEQIINSFLDAPASTTGGGNETDHSSNDNNNNNDLAQLKDQVSTLMQTNTSLQQRLDDQQRLAEQKLDKLTDIVSQNANVIQEVSQRDVSNRAQQIAESFQLSEEEAEALGPIESAMNKVLQKTLYENGLAGDNSAVNQLSVALQEVDRLKQELGNTNKRIDQAEVSDMTALANRTGLTPLMSDSRFSQYLDTPVGFSGMTLRQDLKRAVESYNEGAIQQIINKFKGVENPQGTVPTSSGSTSFTPSSTSQYEMDRAEFNRRQANHFRLLNSSEHPEDREKARQEYKEAESLLKQGKVEPPTV